MPLVSLSTPFPSALQHHPVSAAPGREGKKGGGRGGRREEKERCNKWGEGTSSQ